MCFSASASFSAGVVLTVIGVASVKKAQHSSHLLFASIPLLFGLQQLAEGVLWLTISNPDYVITQKIFTYIFVFFAQVLWPIWVPISILQLEKNATRRFVQKALVGAGLIVGIYLAYCLMRFNVEAKIIVHHIKYVQDYPSSLKYYGSILYVLATIIPLFLSHIRRMWMLGATIFISYIITAIFYDHYILSVWCFFASIISLSIYLMMTEISNTQREVI